MDDDHASFPMDFLRGPDEADRKSLASNAVTRKFRRNTIVLSAGDNGNSLYVVVSGSVKIYLDDERGREHVLRRVVAGGCFGELSMLSEGTRAANVATLETSRIALISRVDFMAYLHRNPENSLKIIQSLVQRIREMTEDVSSLALQDVYGRLTKIIIRSAGRQGGGCLTEPMTHREIASRIGSSREMVTRIISDLRTGGYISTDKKRIRIEKPLPLAW